MPHRAPLINAGHKTDGGVTIAPEPRPGGFTATRALSGNGHINARSVNGKEEFFVPDRVFYLQRKFGVRHPN